MDSVRKNLEEIAREDGRYSAEALEFVFEGLGFTAKASGRSEQTDERRHVSCEDLAYGLKALARQRWGRLAKSVLNEWGVKCTRDFGEIVFLLIEHKWMSSQPTDAIEDFNNLYDFKAEFEDSYEFEATDLK
jgi:uncharacterized repeat protein (TIGR04138 family)